MERIEFLTDDGVTIIGTWQSVSNPSPWCAILLHMLPADRSSWLGFSQDLARRGIASLAIDLRGHGESTHSTDGTLNHRQFSHEQHASTLHDIAGAHSWCLTRGISPHKILLIGASIGANLAMKYCVAHPAIRIATFLSPGLNYHGVTTDDAARKLSQEQHVLFVASTGDTEAFEAVPLYDQSTPAQHDVIACEGTSHGTDMLNGDTFASEKIISWIEKKTATLNASPA